MNAAVLAIYSKAPLPNSNYYTAFAFGTKIDSTHWAYCSWTAQWFNGCGGTVTFTGKVCPDKYTDNGTACQIAVDNIITLQNPLADIEPSGTAAIYANTSTTAYAQVIDQQTYLPQPGVQVKFSVDVVANTGGHNGGHSVMRPKGKLLDCRDNTTEVESTVCITQLDGRATVTFNAPIVSGTHTITATCANPACTGPASGNINVKVDGLATIPASPFYTLVGATDKHMDNHYLTPAAASVLQSLAVSYQIEQRFKLNGVAPPLLHLNDASLTWGGVFDLDADWSPPHDEHKRGTVIDIRANSLAGAIAPENFYSFRVLAKDIGANAKIHNPGEVTQHFHVRLLGRGE